MRSIGLRVRFLLLALLMAGCGKTSPTAAQPMVVRAAVIGGMTTTGLWQAVSARFERATGMKVELVITGERELCAEYLRAGKADLLTMHSGDITTDLVADGYGVNMQPWTRNDLVIVGPSTDPAHIRGMKDGAAALRKIAGTQSPFLDFQGIGSREVAHNLWKAAGIGNPEGTWLLKDESPDKWSALKYAQQRGAYVITGRIPVKDGKLAATDMQIMVEGDPVMRRPFIVMEANPKRFPQANAAGAHALEEFLLSPETQAFIDTFGVGDYGGIPPFHSIAGAGQ
jgi:tungstate transport system substrate-binding protein